MAITGVTPTRIQNVGSKQGDLTTYDYSFSVTVQNNTNVNQNVRVFLFSKQGASIDKEPDLLRKKIVPGASATFTVGTNWDAKFTAADVFPTCQITAESSEGGISDRVIVDTSSGKFNSVSALVGQEVFVQQQTIAPAIVPSIPQAAFMEFKSGAESAATVTKEVVAAPFQIAGSAVGGAVSGTTEGLFGLTPATLGLIALAFVLVLVMRK